MRPIIFALAIIGLLFAATYIASGELWRLAAMSVCELPLTIYILNRRLNAH